MDVVQDNHLGELQQARHLPASPTIKEVARDAHGSWAITITSDGVTDHVHHVAGSANRGFGPPAVIYGNLK